MNGRAKFFCRIVFSTLFFCIIAANVSGQEADEQAENESSLIFLMPAGYEFISLERQTMHAPSAGFGFISAQTGRRFLGMVTYRHVFFQEAAHLGIPQRFHQINAIFDGSINRHRLMFFLGSSSDEPIVGGFSVIQAMAGWGYEVVNRPHTSLTLGVTLGIGDFGIALPSGDPLPVLPLPLIRLNVETQWLALSFTVPTLGFTIAPQQRVRLAGNIQLVSFRSISDIIFECTLWYRLFGADHRMGDFAGIGVGVRSASSSFTISHDATRFEMRQTSVFAVADFSIARIRGGWIFDSRYRLDRRDAGSPGRGWYVSLQGNIPIAR